MQQALLIIWHKPGWKYRLILDQNSASRINNVSCEVRCATVHSPVTKSSTLLFWSIHLLLSCNRSRRLNMNYRLFSVEFNFYLDSGWKLTYHWTLDCLVGWGNFANFYIFWYKQFPALTREYNWEYHDMDPLRCDSEISDFTEKSFMQSNSVISKRLRISRQYKWVRFQLMLQWQTIKKPNPFSFKKNIICVCVMIEFV